MSRGKKRILSIAVIAVIVAMVTVFMKYFNGNLVYLSSGMRSDTLAKLKEDRIYTFEAQILMSDARIQYEKMFGAGIWDEQIKGTTFEAYVKDQIRVKLLRVCCMNVLAKERGVVLGREEKDAVKNAAVSFYDGLEDDIRKQLDVTQESLENMFTEFAIAEKLYRDLTSLMDIEVSSDDARVIKIQYIVSDSREEIDKAYAQIQEGNSFFTVAKQYNAGGEYEYELRRGEMDQAFEEAAYELTTGTTSGIVEADGKFYIIRCTSDNDKAKTEANKTAILEQKQLEMFNKDFEEYEAKLFIEWNDKRWEELRLSQTEILPVSFEELFAGIVIK